MRWLGALAGKTALAAGLALGLPGLIFVFAIALASDVSWAGAAGRGLVALVALGGIGWVGGAVVHLAQEPVDSSAPTIGKQIDLTVGDSPCPNASGQAEGGAGSAHAVVEDRAGHRSFADGR